MSSYVTGTKGQQNNRKRADWPSWIHKEIWARPNSYSFALRGRDGGWCTGLTDWCSSCRKLLMETERRMSTHLHLCSPPSTLEWREDDPEQDKQECWPVKRRCPWCIWLLCDFPVNPLVSMKTNVKGKMEVVVTTPWPPGSPALRPCPHWPLCPPCSSCSFCACASGGCHPPRYHASSGCCC